MNAKPWYLSKTLWLNFLAIAIFAVQTFQGESWFDPKAQAAILAFANFGMRLLTGQAVSVKGAGNVVVVLVLASVFTVAGCAAGKTLNDMAPTTEQQQALAVFGSVAEAATQLSGASAAIAQLAASPETAALLDPTTAQAIANYSAWAALGLKAVGVVSTAASAL